MHLSISFISLLPLQQKLQKNCLSSLPPIPLLPFSFKPTPVRFLSLHISEPGLAKATRAFRVAESNSQSSFSCFNTADSFAWSLLSLASRTPHFLDVPSTSLVAPSQVSSLWSFMLECPRLSPELVLISTFMWLTWWFPPVPWLYHLYPDNLQICSSNPVFFLHFMLIYSPACLRPSFVEPLTSSPVTELLHPEPSPSRSMATLAFQLLRWEHSAIFLLFLS